MRAPFWRLIIDKMETRTPTEAQIERAIELGRPLLIEGPIGVGKTYAVLATLKRMGRSFVRVDGDARFTEAKLTGTFDPILVEKFGISERAFVPGPLVEAMQEGRVLFLNELNRLPEGVQNVLLSVADEGLLRLPRLGEIRAHRDFRIIAAQNPKEFVATSLVSEALLDRFDRMVMDYPSRDSEIEFVRISLGPRPHPQTEEKLQRAVDLVRATRVHPKIKRGASVRAAIALVQWLGDRTSEQDWREALELTLPHRMEWLSESSTEKMRRLELGQLLDELLRISQQKKK